MDSKSFPYSLLLLFFSDDYNSITNFHIIKRKHLLGAASQPESSKKKTKKTRNPTKQKCKKIPSCELTYPPPKVCLKMMIFRLSQGGICDRSLEVTRIRARSDLYTVGLACQVQWSQITQSTSGGTGPNGRNPVFCGAPFPPPLETNLCWKRCEINWIVNLQKK